MNIIEVVNGKLHLLTLREGLGGYCVVCSQNPYYLANNGVEINFEIDPKSVGRLALLIAPYKVRVGIPEYLLKNFDMVCFEVGSRFLHAAGVNFTRDGVSLISYKTFPPNIFSGKLRIENKGGVTSCYFNNDKIGSFPQMQNMNVAVFIEAFPYSAFLAVNQAFPYSAYEANQIVLDAYVDTLSIDEVSTAMLGTQWANMMWVMMTAVMLMTLTAVIKKIREVRK